MKLVPAIALVLGLLASDAIAAPKDADHPGRLLNLAQQQLARGDIDDAITSLDRSLDGDATEGYAWGLMAEALVWGRGHGPEVEASWEALAALTGDGHARLRVVRARMAAARRDKFTGAETPWVEASFALIEEVLDAATDADLQYAALIARRDLRYRVGQGTEALLDGVAANAVVPSELQGRISLVQRARANQEVATFKVACLDIVRTDPWAAEVCSGLWTGHWGEGVEEAREDVLRVISKLEPRALKDPVLANELLKFHKRRKDDKAAAAWLQQVRAAFPDFQLADNSRWYRGSFVVPPPYRKLFADTNRANNTQEPSERLKKLVAIQTDPADGHAMVQRWRWRVAEAALAVDPPDEVLARQQLELITRHDANDARGWMELAGLLPEEPALDALVRAEDAVLGGGWDPWERYGALPFPEALKRRRHFVADLRLRRAELHAAAGDLDGAWALALQAAWSSDSTLPAAWALVADLAEARDEHAFALEADLEHVAALAEAGDAAPDAAPDAVRRFLAARPDLPDADRDAAWVALLAAAEVRRAEREGSADITAARKEKHPFVGKAAPSLTVTDLAGGERTLADLAGRVVVVDFWASWCGPCKRAMPELQQAADALKDAPVTFLLVSVDATKEAADTYWAAANLTMDGVWSADGNAAQGSWRVKGIPSTFVVDQSGVIRHHHQGYRAGEGRVIEAEIRALLATP